MSGLLWSRRLAHGLVSGALLSALRAPLGLDWTQISSVQATTAAGLRAAALLAIGVPLAATRPALRGGLGGTWVAGVAAGFALHALVLEVGPSTRPGLAFLFLAGTALLVVLAGTRAKEPRAEAVPAPEPPRRRLRARASDGDDGPLGVVERVGLLLAGLGCAVALEALARELRVFTMGTAADDAALGTTFLVLLWLASTSFGPLIASGGGERLKFPACVALAGAAAVAGLWFLSLLSPDGLHQYLRSFDHSLRWVRALDEKVGGVLGLARVPTLDGASIGTFWATGIVAAAALVLPAFALGGALGSARHAGRVRYALVGAAVGLAALPSIVRAHGKPLDLEQSMASAFAWELVVAGASASALGVALVGLGARRALGGLALALGVAAVPWIRPRQVVWAFSPWSVARVSPELVWRTPEGLLTVERARDGAFVLTLDRRRLTPIVAEEAADERRLRSSFALLPPERRAGARVLFVGQLTPARASVLRSLGVSEPERTAAWHAAMPAVEELLFRGELAPGGRVLPPAEARAKLADGEYDWVFAPAVRGPVITWKSEARELWGGVDAPRRFPDLEGDTVGVAWIDGDARAAAHDALGTVLVDVELVESLALGVVRGPARAERGEVGPTFESSGQRGPSPLAVLGTMPQLRRFGLEAAWAEGLACESAPELARGLALHFGAQKLSAPGESRAQQIEIEEDALRAFFAAVPPAGELDPLTRVLWESVAWALTEKREPTPVIVYVEPVAERFAPWPELDRAVARAYREVLEADSAVRFLERARAARPLDIDLLLESAACAEDLGDLPAAAGFYEQALGIQPGRPDVERALGLVLVRSGDERGRAYLERALEAHPEDRAVLEALGRPLPDAADG